MSIRPRPEIASIDHHNHSLRQVLQSIDRWTGLPGVEIDTETGPFPAGSHQRRWPVISFTPEADSCERLTMLRYNDASSVGLSIHNTNDSKTHISFNAVPRLIVGLDFNSDGDELSALLDKAERRELIGISREPLWRAFFVPLDILPLCFFSLANERVRIIEDSCFLNDSSSLLRVDRGETRWRSAMAHMEHDFLVLSAKGHDWLATSPQPTLKDTDPSHAGRIRKRGRPRKSKVSDMLGKAVVKMLDNGDVGRYGRRWKQIIIRYANELPKDVTPDQLRKRVERAETRHHSDKK